MGGERRTTFGDPSGWAFEASRRRASRLDGWRSACHAWGRTAPGSESAEKRLLPSLPSSHCCRVPLFRCPFPPHLPFCSTKSSFGDASATPPVVCRSAIVLRSASCSSLCYHPVSPVLPTQECLRFPVCGEKRQLNAGIVVKEAVLAAVREELAAHKEEVNELRHTLNAVVERNEATAAVMKEREGDLAAVRRELILVKREFTSVKGELARVKTGVKATGERHWRQLPQHHKRPC
ncbi:unnamed protein product [Closterium sp. NIES-65]|nr:unnamed protein product [Closterium sp. NIES-65]